MIYAGIDVDIITHEKALAAGLEALGLWTWCMCWTQKHTTDGRIPRVVILSALGEKPRNIRRALVRLRIAGLLHESECGSFFVLHNYGKKNQTAEEIQAKKEASAARARRWREKRNAPSNAPVTRDERVRTDPSPTPSPDNTTRQQKGGRNAEEPPVEEPSEPLVIPRVWGRGPTAERALEVFADAITAVTNEPHHIGPAPWLRDDVCALMNKRAPRDTLANALTWLGDATQAWVRATPGTDERKPSRLNDWLNAGKPDRKARVRAGAIVQSGDNRAWKLPEGLE